MANQKIAILTLFYDNHNYGGLLQSYALQKALEIQGYEAKQIAYILDSGYQDYRGEAIKKIKHLVKIIVYGDYYRKYTKRHNKIKKFELMIPHTRIVKAKEIKCLNSQYDTFICGSDQIWNPVGWQDVLFLSFVSPGKKKIAYAASMGKDSFSKDEAEYFFQNTKEFSHISLREEESISALKYYKEDFNIEVMPDPTMLLSAEEWSRLLKEPIIKEPYIFAYFLGDNMKQRNAAIQYANSIGKKIYFVKYLQIEHKKWEISHQNNMLDGIGVCEFLTLIKNADLVITDSFHGVVFSAIFETPFIEFNRFGFDDKNSMNSRITNLMRLLGINRIRNSLDINDKYEFTSEEKYLIKKALVLQKRKGQAFLFGALEE